MVVKAAGLIEKDKSPKFAFSIVLLENNTVGITESGFKLDNDADLIYRMLCDMKNQMETIRIIEGLEYATVNNRREEEG